MSSLREIYCAKMQIHFLMYIAKNASTTLLSMSNEPFGNYGFSEFYCPINR